jgi:hypothetical protein
VGGENAGGGTEERARHGRNSGERRGNRKRPQDARVASCRSTISQTPGQSCLESTACDFKRTPPGPGRARAHDGEAMFRRALGGSAMACLDQRLSRLNRGRVASRPQWQEPGRRVGWKRDVVIGGGGATQCRILCVATPCVAPPTLLPQQRLASDDSRRIPPRAPRHIRDQSSRFRTDIQRDSGGRAAFLESSHEWPSNIKPCSVPIPIPRWPTRNGGQIRRGGEQAELRSSSVTKTPAGPRWW